MFDMWYGDVYLFTLKIRSKEAKPFDIVIVYT